MRIILYFFGILPCGMLWQCQKSQNVSQRIKNTSQERVLLEEVTPTIAAVDTSTSPPPASMLQGLAPQSSAVKAMPTQLVLGLSSGIQAPTVVAWSISGTCATLPTIGGLYPITTDDTSWSVSLEGGLCQEGQTSTVQVDPAKLVDKNGQQVIGSLISNTYTLRTVGPSITWTNRAPSLLRSATSYFSLPFTFDTGATVVNGTASASPLLFTGVPTCKVELQDLAPTGGTLLFSGCTGDGAWSVQVQSGLVQDEAGNLSTASSALSFTVDTTPPTAMALLPSSVTRLKVAPITIQATLSEPVQTSVSPQLLGVSGCQSTPQVKSVTYDVRTPGVQFQLSDGSCLDGDTLTVTLDPTQLVDLAGNAGTGAPISRTYTIHTVGPSLVLTPPEKTLVNVDVSTTMQATWTNTSSIIASSNMPNPLFSLTAVSTSPQEPPPSCTFSLGEISITGGSATSPISISQCTGSGTLSFSLTSGVVQDELGNPSSASSAGTLLVDNTPPRLLSLSPSTATRLNPLPTQVQAVTTKPVSTLLSSVTSFFAVSTASPCRVTLSTPTISTSGTTSVLTASVSSSGCVDGNTMTISADPTKLVDAVGNRGVGSVLQQSYTLQTKGPVATLTAPTNTNLSGSSIVSIPVTWTSSGTISAVTPSFYTLTPNGPGVSCTVAADPIQLNGTSASTTLRVSSCTGPGPTTNPNSTFVLSVNAGAVKDDFNNPSSASTGISFTVDSTPPTLVSYPATSQTITSSTFTVPISISMSEPVTSIGAAVTYQNCGGTVSSSGASGFLNGATSATGSLTFNGSGCINNGSKFVVTIDPTLLRDAAGNVGTGSPLILTYTITFPPVTPGSGSLSQPVMGSALNGDGSTITPTVVYGWRLSWGGASEGVGPYQYRVQYAYKQADNTMSASTTLLGWTTPIISTTVLPTSTSLIPALTVNGTTVMVDVTSLPPTEVNGSVVPYTFSIQVKDANSTIASYSSATSSQLNKYAFVLDGKTGNMGGVSGADAACMRGRPLALSGFTFKAMLVNDPALNATDSTGAAFSVTTPRVANPLTNWVLTPDTTYFYPTGLIVNGTGTTSVFSVDTNGIPLSTTNASGARIANGWSSSTILFTGLGTAWKTLTNKEFTGYGDRTCLGWQTSNSGPYTLSTTLSTTTSTVSGVYLYVSIGYLNTSPAIQFWGLSGSGICSHTHSILCVQQ